MKTRILSVLAIWFSAILLGIPVLTWSSIDSSDWVFVGAPPGDTSLRDMVVDPENDSLWYVGSQTNGLYVTRDGGNNWEQHISGTVGAIVIDPNNYNIVYASSGSDLYRSDNQGVTWNLVFSFPNSIPGSPFDSPTFIDSILVSVMDGTIVIGLTSQFHSARVYTSSDGGTTWDISFESEAGFHIWDLAEVPSNGYWFFCTEDSGHAVDSVVMRSTNRGQSWEEMVPLRGTPTAGHGLNLNVHSVTQVVYFLTESSFLSSSTDFGDTWSVPRNVDFGSVLLIDTNHPNRFFGGEFVRGLKVGGVYFSEDTGESFSFIGPSDKSIGSLALNGGSTELFAVVFGDGIYVIGLPDDTTQVAIDIKPGSCPNPLNLKSRGVLPVAILGTESFDVTTIDVSSILLSRDGNGGGVAPIRWSYEDVATPFGGELCGCHELGPDGFMDLTLKFRTQEVVRAIGGVDDGDEVVLILTGQILDGNGTNIEGADCVRILKKGKKDLNGEVDLTGEWASPLKVTGPNGKGWYIVRGNCWVMNIGDIPAGRFEAQVYYSGEDDQFDEGDTPILKKPKRIPKLLPGKKKRVNFNYKTDQYPSGTFFLAVDIPGTGVIDELDEGNNVIPNP